MQGVSLDKQRLSQRKIQRIFRQDAGKRILARMPYGYKRHMGNRISGHEQKRMRRTQTLRKKTIESIWKKEYC